MFGSIVFVSYYYLGIFESIKQEIQNRNKIYYSENHKNKNKKTRILTSKSKKRIPLFI
jgi:archaellum component FlaF (FlaF/FlaG flagellin family)